MQVTGNPESPYNSDDVVVILVGTLKSRWRWVVGAALVTALVATLIGAVYYTTQHLRRSTSVIFDVTFPAADQGRYPNNLPFRPADITGATVLDDVYDRNDAARFCGRDAFRGGFVIGSTASMQYKLSFVPTGDCTRVPEAIAAKALNDTVSMWAEEAKEKRGVLKLRLAVLTPSVFEASADNTQGLLVRITLLRAALTRAIENVRQVEGFVGAELFRGPANISFHDIELRLQDLRDVRFESAFSAAASALSASTAELVPTLLARSEHNLQVANARAQIYATALRDYSAAYGASHGSQNIDGVAAEARPSPRADDTINAEAEYRVSLTRTFIEESMKSLEYQDEADRYRRVIDAGRHYAPAPLRQPSAVFDEIIVDGKDLMGQFDALYEEFSRVSLHPASTIYRIARGPETVLLREFSLQQYLFVVLVTAIATAFCALIAFVLYDQFLVTSVSTA